ncbi:MAG: hypothetical protein LZF60_270018 [Nitrospira sp.]|nr:MAG: hypothetical protein LZF60_270018 [Nitrospira sp.]
MQSASWLETVSGISWQLGVPLPLVLACCRAATAGKNWSGQVHTVLTMIRPTFCVIWMNAGFGLTRSCKRRGERHASNIRQNKNVGGRIVPRILG